jgi:hypothetical protein
VTGELFEHVIEKSNAGINVVNAIAIQIERHKDFRLFGLALDSGDAALAGLSLNRHSVHQSWGSSSIGAAELPQSRAF